MQKRFLLISLSFIFSNLSSQTLSVNPNPVYQRALTSFTISNADSVSLMLVDISGKIILTPRPTSFLSAGIYQDSLILDSYPAGIYYLSLKIKSGNSQVIKLIKTAPVGIVQFNQSSVVNIYPNPFNDEVNFEIALKNFQNQSFTIHNSFGQIVHSGLIQNYSEKMNLSTLPSGTYFLWIKSESEPLKIVKQ